MSNKLIVTRIGQSRFEPRLNVSLWESNLAKRTSKISVVLTSAILLAATLGLAACGASVYSESSGLPNLKLTPGATNPAVTQANIKETICVVGWTATIRPPVTYTNQLKYRQLHSGYNLNGDLDMQDYEEDHQVPLEVGGNPSSELNLWPEPHNIKDGSYVKDQLENRVHQLVCSGAITLKVGQAAFLGNWEKSYAKYLGPLP